MAFSATSLLPSRTIISSWSFHSSSKGIDFRSCVSIGPSRVPHGTGNAGTFPQCFWFPAFTKCMADPPDIPFCIATSAVLRSSHRSRIFGAIATTMCFAGARPSSVRSCLTYRLPPTYARVCARPRLTWPKVSRCRDTSSPTATCSTRASSAHGGPFSFRTDVAYWLRTGPHRMSAQRSLSERKRTSRGLSVSVAFDPIGDRVWR